MPIVFFLACAVFAFQPTDWPQFRGQFSSGVSQVGAPPTEWTNENDSHVAWRLALPGRGVGGAIVVGGQVIVTSSSGTKQDQLHVFAIDDASGKIRWQRSFWGTGRTACHPLSAMSAPTPASNGQRILALFASNDVVCLDMDGNLQWVRSLGTEYPLAFDDRGLASSPLIVDDIAVIQVACQGTSFVAALELDSGNVRWRQELSKTTNWTSPCAINIGGGNCVVVQSADELLVLDAKSGESRWNYKADGALIPSPVITGSTIYLPADGLTCLQLSEGADQVEVQWKNNNLGPQSASPIIAGDHVLVMRPPNVLTCGSAADGKVLWKKRIEGEQFWATPALAGNHLYIASAEGKVHVIDVANEGAIVGTVDMEEEILASPAISGDAIYLRGVTHIWKIAAET